MARRAPRRQPVINRLVARVLRSPISGIVDGSLLLLTLRGHRSGRPISPPVQYAAGEGAIWVWPGHPEAKSWWRNLRVPAPVSLRLRGQDVVGTARALYGADEPAEVKRGLRVYAGRFPHTAFGGDTADLAALAKRSVIVRIRLPEPPVESVQATNVGGSGLAAAIRRHPLGAYFLLAYLCSWGYWVPLALAGGHVSHFPGLLGPMLSAVVTTAIVEGRPGLRGLLARMARWRVSPRWYGAAAAPLAAGLVGLAGMWPSPAACHPWQSSPPCLVFQRSAGSACSRWSWR